MVMPLVTTTYYVEVDDGSQTVTDSVLVTVNPPPEIILGEWPEYLCNTDDPVQLMADPEGGIYNGPGNILLNLMHQICLLEYIISG